MKANVLDCETFFIKKGSDGLMRFNKLYIW